MARKRRRDLEDSEPTDDDVESDDEMEIESENEEANDDSNELAVSTLLFNLHPFPYALCILPSFV